MTTSTFAMPFSSFNADSFSKFFAMPDSVGTLARESMAASTESTRASMKGMQDVSAAVLRQMKDYMALSVETSKKLSEVSTLQDAMTIQAGFMKSTVEANMKGFTELSTMVADTMREAMAPLAKQAQKATKAA